MLTLGEEGRKEMGLWKAKIVMLKLVDLESKRKSGGRYFFNPRISDNMIGRCWIFRKYSGC